MERAALRLCGQVRRLVIEAPEGGDELARWLRRQYGMPILPPEDGGGAGQRQCRPAGAHSRGLVGAPQPTPFLP